MTPDVLRIHDSRTLAILLFAVSAGVLGTVYASQYLGGLQPCNLCLYQRWPWWIAGGLGAVAAFAPISATVRGWLCFAAGLSVLAGAGIAAYHTGVEQHWWQGPTTCGAGAIPSSFADMQRMMATPIVPCDKPAWTLLGISMAGYNAAFSLVFGGFAVERSLRGLREGRAT
jgi:disulfide bond formation protein DsbB